MNDLVYIDEKGFNLHQHRRRGRAKRGQKALIPVVNGRGKNISICAAVSPVYGVMAYQVELGSFNRDRYIEFLDKLLKHHAFQNRSMRLVMDNVGFHRGELVGELIEHQRFKHIRQFIPKYSPHLNAIEYCFGQWAWFINRHPRNTEIQLVQLIQEAALATRIKQCEGWHHEVTRYHIMCAAGQPLKFQPPRPLKKKKPANPAQQ
jgi:transposase